MKQKLLPIVLASLLLGLLFDFLFYGKTLGLSLSLYSALILVTTLYLTLFYKRTLDRSAWLVAVLVLFFSAFGFVRASALLIFLDIWFVIYLLLMIVQLMLRTKHGLSNYTIRDYINHTLSLPVKFVDRFFVFGKHLIDSNTDTTKKSKSSPILKGLVLSLPILAIFLALLSSADLVFKHFVTSLFDFNLSAEFFWRWMLILFIASLFAGAYYLLFAGTAEELGSEPPAKKMTLGTTETSIILGSVGLLFLAFVLIQITYLFGGEANITSAGFTYAQYARKGFFELIAVAVISLGLILTLNSSTAPHGSQKKLFVGLNGLLIAEVLLMMLSAHKRLSLYETAYGFTALRFYSHLFIGWLAAVFILTAIYLFRREQQSLFALRVFISIITFMALVNLINPDAFIARQNIKRFNDSGKLDLVYLTTLSEDATPELNQLLKTKNEGLNKNLAHAWYMQMLAEQAKTNNWQSFNLARSRAQKIFKENSAQLEVNKDYSPTAQDSDDIW